jgi:4'-phosphopantetheinyl transferase
VHVWRADLEAVSDDLIGLLCAEERVRAGRFLSDRDRRLWARARGVLRALLGRYLQRDPRTLRFTVGEHGKPALLEDPANASVMAQSPSPTPVRLSFNMSHSRGLALYVFSDAGDVGIDVEVAGRAIDEVAVAARTLGSVVARRLEALEPGVRQQEFLRAWVRNEAELKCRGIGIGSRPVGEDTSGLWVKELEVGPQAAAAVALEQPARGLHCWDWQP